MDREIFFSFFYSFFFIFIMRTQNPTAHKSQQSLLNEYRNSEHNNTVELYLKCVISIGLDWLFNLKNATEFRYIETFHFTTIRLSFTLEMWNESERNSCSGRLGLMKKQEKKKDKEREETNVIQFRYTTATNRKCICWMLVRFDIDTRSYNSSQLYHNNSLNGQWN